MLSSNTTLQNFLTVLWQNICYSMNFKIVFLVTLGLGFLNNWKYQWFTKINMKLINRLGISIEIIRTYLAIQNLLLSYLTSLLQFWHDLNISTIQTCSWATRKKTFPICTKRAIRIFVGCEWSYSCVQRMFVFRWHFQ